MLFKNLLSIYFFYIPYFFLVRAIKFYNVLRLALILGGVQCLYPQHRAETVRTFTTASYNFFALNFSIFAVLEGSGLQFAETTHWCRWEDLRG